MSVRSTYKMRNRCLLMSILALASSAMLATSTFAAESGATEHEGVSLKPQMLVHFGGFGITNSMLVTWIIAAGIIWGWKLGVTYAMTGAMLGASTSYFALSATSCLS